jgi:lipopolysaccharide/colanic/teichoic acid biosynthesis glycosyltransferase
MLELFLNGALDTPHHIYRLRLSLVLWALRAELLQKTKRLFDLFFALGSLPLVLPLMGLVAVVIRLDSPGPILFRQVRVGRWGRPFHCYKFRSMVLNAESLKAGLAGQNEADEVVFKMRRDPRVTRVGRVIRKLSIDELPQVFNVLKGDMSLVGPRPPVPIELEYYPYEYFSRLDAVPGITGLQQVSGRSDLPFKRWVELDLIYIQEQSLLKDLEILLRTVPTVISRKGAY